ncbi:GNAT family N-acetyltransferase [Wenzhouxiangella sp. AB-CW3]|uniref:bifunctional GNAT family N-acetyltransferase/carbon-nitrogen hydrolase family protein n=1 Tax=Wenzhouxiangella sp. AB-CW3 TaxID=2771012 RepID=UPI00168BDFAD|nr:bifunctional GNAT family N-acetyltransferase/carbon-nitrogen hydrolase family protein [Wenzhouxiangella sp. AB-CW3]QOC23690.1 GNAT family N-acetyltransferase [Wenzhouxiangella sp. AB-CW3]
MTQSEGNTESHRLILRQSQPDDYDDVAEIMEAVYPGLDGAWTREQFESQIARFPEGQICIEDNGKVVAAAISLMVKYSRWGQDHKYWDIVGNGYLTTHDPKGDVLYGVDVFVHPDYRALRLGRRLYDARKELCENLNLRSIVVGGRIPGYHRHADEMTAAQYVAKVKASELVDPILTFQLANDFQVRRIVRGYLPDDEQSAGYATLLEWINIHFEEDTPGMIGGRPSDVRVGAVQWQMRPTRSLDDLYTQIEYFVDAVSGYQADVVLFPEFFNGPLMASYNDEGPAEAVRQLADYTDAIRDRMQQFAVSYNINIIAGSMPEYDGERLRNVCYLLRRDGTWDRQYKVHVTPDEVSYWGLKGGDKVKIFETDVGKVGILICYDVEFPELPRLLAEEGMNILFVPYWVDTKNAYLRVRRCAQARAIENECYVVITGSVGNLPRVDNMDMQYSQAAVFTPSDFAFPHDAIAHEATANTETMLIADLDLDNLREIRSHGSVRNLKDRRLDLYELKWK